MNCSLIREQKGGAELCAEIAADILVRLQHTPLLLLKGNLGTGKTTLCKEILKQAGYRLAVSSPTFNLVNEYRTETGRTFYHFDLYRIKHPEELDEIGFMEYLDSGHPCLIEWPELAEQILDLPHLRIEIEHAESERIYSLYACS